MNKTYLLKGEPKYNGLEVWEQEIQNRTLRILHVQPRSPLAITTSRLYNVILPYMVFILRPIEKGFYRDSLSVEQHRTTKVLYVGMRPKPLTNMNDTIYFPFLGNIGEDLTICLGRPLLDTKIVRAIEIFYETEFTTGWLGDSFRNYLNLGSGSYDDWQKYSKCFKEDLIPSLDWKDKNWIWGTFEEMANASFYAANNFSQRNLKLYQKLVTSIACIRDLLDQDSRLRKKAPPF